MFDRDGGLTELIYHIIWWSGCLDGKYESFQNVFFSSVNFLPEKKNVRMETREMETACSKQVKFWQTSRCLGDLFAIVSLM